MNASEILKGLNTLTFVLANNLIPIPHDLEVVQAAIEYIQQHEQIVRVNQQIAQED